jgi:hypothetical protein
MKKIICITFAVIVFTFAAAANSYACSCSLSRDSVKTQITTAYKDSAAIFSGSVTSVKPSSDGMHELVTITVKDSWKGNVTGEVTVKTAKDSSMCGYNFEVGTDYIVYTYGAVTELNVNNCSRTRGFANKTDVKYLDKLKKKYQKKS